MASFGEKDRSIRGPLSRGENTQYLYSILTMRMSVRVFASTSSRGQLTTPQRS